MLKFSVFAVNRSLSALAVWAGVTMLAGCGSVQSVTSTLPSVESLATPYRIDIVQGNFVSREQAAALAPGMPRAQVRDMLGTPLLASAFHADRWDYAFTFSRPGLAPQKRKLTVFFKGDVLERVESDELPTGGRVCGLARIAQTAGTCAGAGSQRTGAEGIAERNAATNKAKPEPPTAPPIANYPPMEPPATAGTARRTCLRPAPSPGQMAFSPAPFSIQN